MSTIHFTRQGSGEPVVLVHGIGHHGEAWRSLPQRLAEKYDVITVDLPGHGASPKPPKGANYSMRSSAEQLEGLFAELGIDRPHVIGNSLGGQMALELAARGTVRSATALSPAGFFSPLAAIAWLGPNLLILKASSYVPQLILRPISKSAALRRLTMGTLYTHAERLTPQEYLSDTLNLRRSRGFWAHLLRGVSLRFVGDPDVPTTVAWAEKDKVLLPGQAKVAKRRMPRATHVPLPGCGHCSQHDDPDLVIRVAEETFERARALEGQAAVAS